MVKVHDANVDVELGPIEWNHKNLRRFLRGELGGVEEILAADAGKVLAAAKAAAPVATGDYKQSLYVRDQMRPSRLTKQVRTDAPHARHVEREYSVLGRAMGASVGEKGRGE